MRLDRYLFILIFGLRTIRLVGRHLSKFRSASPDRDLKLQVSLLGSVMIDLKKSS